jgi:hypothetical protein
MKRRLPLKTLAQIDGVRLAFNGYTSSGSGDWAQGVSIQCEPNEVHDASALRMIAAAMNQAATELEIELGRDEKGPFR